MGRTYKTMLRYAEIGLALDPGVGGIASEYVFSANNLYDPNVTGTGHQPTGFDELMSIYDHFTVIGSKITVTFQNTDPARNHIIAVSARDNATTSTDIRVLIENGRAKVSTLSPAQGGHDIRTITQSCAPHKYLGRSTPLSDPDLRGSASAGPGEQVYWVLTAQPSDAYDTAQVFIWVVIEYVAVFTEPKQLALS